MTQRPPNFLVVMTDQQRADSISHAPDTWTPHTAAFARDGVHLSQVYCPSPHCCPSRASFFTGLFPSRHGIWNNILNQHALSRDPRPGTHLWSESLAAAGYDLHFAGKWHVAHSTTPKDHGWTEHRLSAVGGRDRHGPLWEHYDRLAAQPEPATRGRGVIVRPGYGDRPIYTTEPPGWKLQHDEDVLTDTMSALDAVATSDAPWMLYAGFFGPHDIFQATPEWLDAIPDHACELPPSYHDTLRDKPGIHQRLREQIWDQLTPDEMRECRRHYLAYCHYEDHLFGTLLAHLRATGAEDNTVVVFLSDHGDYQGEHGLLCKGIAPYRGAYHVPGYVRWPAGGISGGRVSDALVSLADFGPTFLDLAGVQAPEHTRFTGRSLAPILRGGMPAGWRDHLVTQCNGVEWNYSQRSVFTRDWKYVFNGFDRDELYDLRADPHEMVNLARDPHLQPVVREMCRRMWRFCREEGDDIISDYFTIAFAPYGPADAFRPE